MGIDLNKSLEFFNPIKVERMCHVIGCGSIGSNVAELLARYGIKNITLWDFDDVEAHNIANQLYNRQDIGKRKTLCLFDKLLNINNELQLSVKNEGWNKGDKLSGYVFLCLDNIDTRKALVEDNLINRSIEAIFDFRTSLLEAQNYFAKWTDNREREWLLSTMDFSHEEAQAETPVSACGFELSVSPVVKTAAINGICQFTNYINKAPIPKIVISRPYDFNTLSLK